MPKGLNDHNMNKGRSESEHQGQGHKERGGLDRGIANGQPLQQQDRQVAPGDGQQQQPSLRRLLQNARGIRRENQGKNMNDGNLNNGNKRGNNCLSKMLMMALPLVAIGAYLFVR